MVNDEHGVLRTVNSPLSLAEPSLLVHFDASTSCVVQVLLETVRLLKGDLVLDQVEHRLTVSSATADASYLALIGSEGQLIVYHAQGGKLVVIPTTLSPIVNGLEEVATACLYHAFDAGQMLGLVRAGSIEPGAGIFETYTIDPTNGMTCVFRSAASLPLCLPVLSNALVHGSDDHMTVKDSGVAAGVLANARVLEMQICLMGEIFYFSFSPV